MKYLSILALYAVIMTLLTACNNTPTPQMELSENAQQQPLITAQPTVSNEVTSGEEQHYWEGNDPNFKGYSEPTFTHDDVVLLAKTVWGEARGCVPEEQRLVVWTVLQRVDANKWGNTIADVITAKNQFVGYKNSNPVDPDIYALCAAELADWWHGTEPPTHEVYAPTAPYFFFDGDGKHNWFREEW